MAGPKPLLLVGARGLAREVLAAVRAGGLYHPLGALDDDVARHGADLDGVPVLGGVDLVHDHPDALVILCTANATRPGGRLDLARKLDLPDDRWATVVHPLSSVAVGTEVGPGTVLLGGAVITAPLAIGAHVLAMPHVLVTHDDEIADGVTLAGRVTLGGGVHLDEACYLGQGALIREYVTVGARAVVGMGSAVLRDVPAGQTWAGVPARRLEC